MEKEKNSLKCSEKVFCEKWKPINGYENLYMISNKGNVKSLDRIVYQKAKSGIARHVYKGKNIKQTLQKNGYYTVDLHKNGKFIRFSVHRLVGIHFIKNPKNKPYINHLDANKQNNVYNNLEWCTQSENIQYAYDNKTKIAPHQRKVGQYTLSHDLINTWDSLTEAERQTGIFESNIYKCCRNKRKTAGGFIWKYIQ